MDFEKMDLASGVDFEYFLRFAEGLQHFLGDQCEIVIHDFRLGSEHSITHIFNGKLSGRCVGGSSRGAMISHMGEDIEKYWDSRIYFYTGTNGQSGRIFKSCTTMICDKEHRIIGSVCLNLDVTDFIFAQNTLQNFVRYNMPSLYEIRDEDVAFENVDDVLQYYMGQCEQLIGKPMSLMNKAEKIRALKYLNDKGVFKITKANVLLCQSFQISKYTLYNYLEEAKNLHGSNTSSSAEDVTQE